MLVYDGALPPGALVRRHAAAPVWLQARACDFSLAGAPPQVVRWTARTGSAIAVAVAANGAGTAFDGQGLCFQAGVNAGLVLADLPPAPLTIGLIYRAAPAPARTLLSLQQRGAEGYLFLDAQGAAHRLAQKDGSLALPQQGQASPATLAIVALTPGAAALSVDGAAPVTAACDAGTAPADLFIGCRGPRSGLRNKLGSFTLTDVFIWPGQDALAGGVPAPALALWQERCADA